MSANEQKTSSVTTNFQSQIVMIAFEYNIGQKNHRIED